MPTLFPKSSKGSLFRKAQADEQFDMPPVPPTHGGHRRKVSLASSLASTITRSSTESHRSKPGGGGGWGASFDPLSCHPPLCINTSPHFDEDRYREDSEREDRFFNQTQRAQDHYQDAPELSPVKGENCFFHRDNRRRITYVYDQATQWPLKDWQTIPPGLADIDDLSSEPTTPLTPRPPSSRTRPDDQKRPVDWMTRDPGSFFVKRGEWKRRGIVFHLDDDAEEEQERHFPIEEPFEFPG
ncbi:hypothetical protein SLS62_006941 [Diatrype stigma]|uniref:Uncharacterized protein n=1 Tax=Diatrype stigma TaxID=117547 RepID=A0AAN9YQS1_9PEZI